VVYILTLFLRVHDPLAYPGGFGGTCPRVDQKGRQKLRRKPFLFFFCLSEFFGSKIVGKSRAARSKLVGKRGGSGKGQQNEANLSDKGGGKKGAGTAKGSKILAPPGCVTPRYANGQGRTF
jgi:hypothetical protein